MRRFGPLALLIALLLGVPAPPARAAVTVVVVEGRGHGHGVGMAQDGAYWMGQAGRTMDQILDHFYPGTGRGSGTATARVVVFVAPEPHVAIEFPDGGELRSPRSGPQRSGFPIRIGPGGSATIRFDGGAYVVSASGQVSAAAAQQEPQPVQLPTSTTSSTSTTSTSSTSTTTTTLLPFGTSSSTTTSAPESSTSTSTPGGPAPAGAPRSPEPVWAGPVSADASIAVPARGLRYRGELEVTAATGALRVINELDVEQYLWGLGEVSAAWSQESLRAQIVAARTYALRALAANGEICDTQRCQVYKGRNGEFRGQVDAVNATLGTVLTYNGRFASAVYSANAAGISATPEEGFGTPNASHPYLRPAKYDSQSDDPWEVRIALSDLAARLGYPGTATSVRVASKGPSGRPLTVELDGDAGPVVKPALEADAAMGLRSTMWSVRLERADTAPIAPDQEALVQAQPDDVGAVIAEQERVISRLGTAYDAPDRAIAEADATPGPDDENELPPAWPFLAGVIAAGMLGLRTLRTANVPVLPGSRRRRRDEPLRASRSE